MVIVRFAWLLVRIFATSGLFQKMGRSLNWRVTGMIMLIGQLSLVCISPQTLEDINAYQGLDDLIRIDLGMIRLYGRTRLDKMVLY